MQNRDLQSHGLNNSFKSSGDVNLVYDLSIFFYRKVVENDIGFEIVFHRFPKFFAFRIFFFTWK